MTDWTEAAVDTAIRTVHARRPPRSVMIRVAPEVRDELLRIQQEFYAEHHGRISLSDIIKARLAL